MLFLSEGLVPWVAALFLSSEIMEQMSSNATMMDGSYDSVSAQREPGEDQDLDDAAEMVEYDDEEDEIDFTDVIDTSKVPRHVLGIIRHPSSIIRHPSSIIRHPSPVIHHPTSVICHTHV